VICCVIPTYRARATICDVIHGVLRYVDAVVVVDDGCPDGSGEAVALAFPNAPVYLIRHASNGGVGRATKTGIAKALELDAEIIIKVDADGQMDPAYIPNLVEILRSDPEMVYVKGNRFFNAAVVSRMPRIRLVGNAILSLRVKFSSGYWNILDPTNGYFAFNARALTQLDWPSFADNYFFEISILCTLGLYRSVIGELEMATIYGDERSSLSIGRVLWEFPRRLLGRFVRRIMLQYFIFDVNLGTLCLLFGTLLCAGGLAFGVYEWFETRASGVPRTTGTVLLAVLPILIGFQLLLNALTYDVQFGPKSIRRLAAPPGRDVGSRGTRVGLV
jgi:dolichol-phosphate mannosyltransferase